MNRFPPHHPQLAPWYAQYAMPPLQPYPIMHPPMQQAVPPPLAAPTHAPGPAAPSSSGSNFVKGALVGAVAAYILTNDRVQQAAIKSAVKSWSLLQGGIEEMKERFRDAEAELHAAGLEE